MQYHLLYDAGCSRCAALAAEIETASDGRLGLRNLRDEAVVTLLDQHAPNRKWEPLVLETNGSQVRVYGGLAMRARLLMVLGISKALEVARLVQKANGPVLGFEPKWFRPLATSIGVGAVLAFFGFGGDDESRDPCDGYVCQNDFSCPNNKEHCNNVCYRPNGTPYCQSGGWQCGC